MDAEFCQVLVTFADRAAADALLKVVVEERLAACAHVDGPITSTYWWKGKIAVADEWRVEFRTQTTLLDSLTARVIDLHKYETPQVVATPVIGGSSAYLDWMREETDARHRSASATE